MRFNKPKDSDICDLLDIITDFFEKFKTKIEQREVVVKIETEKIVFDKISSFINYIEKIRTLVLKEEENIITLKKDIQELFKIKNSIINDKTETILESLDLLEKEVLEVANNRKSESILVFENIDLTRKSLIEEVEKTILSIKENIVESSDYITQEKDKLIQNFDIFSNNVVQKSQEELKDTIVKIETTTQETINQNINSFKEKTESILKDNLSIYSDTIENIQATSKEEMVSLINVNQKKIFKKYHEITSETTQHVENQNFVHVDKINNLLDENFLKIKINSENTFESTIKRTEELNKRIDLELISFEDKTRKISNEQTTTFRTNLNNSIESQIISLNKSIENKVTISTISFDQDAKKIIEDTKIDLNNKIFDINENNINQLRNYYSDKVTGYIDGFNVEILGITHKNLQKINEKINEEVISFEISLDSQKRDFNKSLLDIFSKGENYIEIKTKEVIYDFLDKGYVDKIHNSIKELKTKLGIEKLEINSITDNVVNLTDKLESTTDRVKELENKGFLETKEIETINKNEELLFRLVDELIIAKEDLVEYTKLLRKSVEIYDQKIINSTKKSNSSIIQIIKKLKEERERREEKLIEADLTLYDYIKKNKIQRFERIRDDLILETENKTFIVEDKKINITNVFKGRGGGGGGTSEEMEKEINRIINLVNAQENNIRFLSSKLENQEFLYKNEITRNFKNLYLELERQKTKKEISSKLSTELSENNILVGSENGFAEESKRLIDLELSVRLLRILGHELEETNRRILAEMSDLILEGKDDQIKVEKTMHSTTMIYIAKNPIFDGNNFSIQDDDYLITTSYEIEN